MLCRIVEAVVAEVLSCDGTLSGSPKVYTLWEMIDILKPTSTDDHTTKSGKENATKKWNNLKTKRGWKKYDMQKLYALKREREIVLCMILSWSTRR